MLKTLPGTTLEFDWSRLEEAEKTLSSLFLAGGLTEICRRSAHIMDIPLKIRHFSDTFRLRKQALLTAC